MFCTDCGREFEGNYCPYCGTPIIELRGGIQPPARSTAPEPASTPAPAPAPGYARTVRGTPAAAVTAIFAGALVLGMIGIIAAFFVIL